MSWIKTLTPPTKKRNKSISFIRNYRKLKLAPLSGEYQVCFKIWIAILENGNKLWHPEGIMTAHKPACNTCFIVYTFAPKS
jgi:hypothetical protein